MKLKGVRNPDDLIGNQFQQNRLRSRLIEKFRAYNYKAAVDNLAGNKKSSAGIFRYNDRCTKFQSKCRKYL